MPSTAPYQANQPHLSGSNINSESLPATLPPSIPALQGINKLLSLIKASIVSASPTPNNSTPCGASALHENALRLQKRPISVADQNAGWGYSRSWFTGIEVHLTSLIVQNTN